MEVYPSHVVVSWIGHSEKVARKHYLQLSTWGGVHPHLRIHLPQADMLGTVGAKRGFSGLKDHGLSAQRDAIVCHGVNVTLLLATQVIKRGIEKNC